MLKEILALFDWTKIKILLYRKKFPSPFKEGEVWWCNIGRNVGVEIYGKGSAFLRPVVVLKKFHANLFFGIPLTTQPKEGIWYVKITHQGLTEWVILNQGRSFDSRRLVRSIGTLSVRNLENIRCGFANLHGFENTTPRAERGV